MLRMVLMALWVCSLLLYPIWGAAQIISDEVPEDIARNNRTGNGGLNHKHLYMLGNIGAAVPLGNYGSQSYFNINSGFAKPGFNGQINVGKLFSRYFGITASAGVLQNNINTAAYEELLSLAFTYSTNPPQLLVASNLQYRGYFHWYTTAGLLVTLAVRENLAVDFRAQGGISYGVDSKMDFVVSDQAGNSINIIVNQARSPALLLNPGINIRMIATKRLLLAINLDYFMAAHNYSGRTLSGAGVTGQFADYDVTMHNFVAGFGLGIYLD